MFFPRLLSIICLWFVATLSYADGPQVRLSTTAGEIVLELAEDRAPLTVKNFLEYVDDGFYNGTIFHRVIDGFMVQGGGFNQDYSRKPTRAAIPNEANNGLRNQRYTIAMARTNSPHSATAQFFINTGDNPNLDHTSATPRGWGYAVFGRVVEGQDVIDAISAAPTGTGGPFSRDVPRTQIVIEQASRYTAKGAEQPNDSAPSIKNINSHSNGANEQTSALAAQ